MQSTAASVDEYLETVPPERLEALTRIRALCREVLNDHDESMEYGMPAYRRGDAVEVAFNSQKGYIALYVQKEVVDRYRDQLPDAGKGCIRFRTPDRIDFALVERMLRSSAESTAHTCP